MIEAYISNNNVYIWRASDASELREKHRIVGTLVGCLPRLPRQNVHLGLPLQLLPEEVTLLLEKGIITVLQNIAASGSIPGSEIEAFHHEREQLYQRQVDLCREAARQRMTRHLPMIVEGLRAKKRRQLEETRSTGEEVSQSELDDVEFSTDHVEIPPLPEKHSCIQLPTACVLSKKYDEAKWTFPSSEEEILRYRVFRDFHDNGYWLTNGGKFGGDFLVYPGDPARFHSFYIAICVPYHKRITALDITAYSRLGANVKKTVTLCSLDDSDHVTYTSLQWTGIT